MKRVYSDMRWAGQTGVGSVLTALVKRKPSYLELIDLNVHGSIGSLFSPLALSHALRQNEPLDGVFWSAGFVPPATMRVPVIVTVHDLTHLHFYSRLHAAYYQYFLKPLFRRCHAIVCVSEFTRQEFIAWSGIPSSKVHLVRNGVEKAYQENHASLELPYRYILYPGNHRSYKNLDRLISAFANSSLPKQDIHLVMTGEPNQTLINQGMGLGVNDYLHFLGRVESKDLPKIYKGALLIAFVSLYEGFGLPILEAMASEVPVLTSNVSSMPEVAGGAALIIDPYSVEEIANGLNRLILDLHLRDELVARGKERVKDFDWDLSARELWSIVDRAYRTA